MLEKEKERNACSLKTYYNDPNCKMDTAKIIEKRLFTCKRLLKKNTFAKSYKTKVSFKKYSFDVHKCNKIFDHLLEGKMLKIPNDVELHSKEDLKRQK